MHQQIETGPRSTTMVIACSLRTATWSGNIQETRIANGDGISNVCSCYYIKL